MIHQFRHGQILFGWGLVMSLSATCAVGSLSYSNPFHPEQCDLAIASARHALSRSPGDARAREILAEGLLCRGLEQDDPWALEAAIRGFEERLAAKPDDFFAQIYLAEAFRRRYPLSDEVIVALQRAVALLADADLGLARDQLSVYLAGALGDAKAHRKQFLPRLLRLQARSDSGALTPREVADLATLLGHTGRAGFGKALAKLDAELARSHDAGFDAFYRAELLRGRQRPSEVAALYRIARDALCSRTGGGPGNECERARRRLEQLDAAGQPEGG